MKKQDDIAESPIRGMISINLSPDENSFTSTENLNLNHILVLPTRNLVLFPGVALPIQLGRKSSVAAAEQAKATGMPLAVVCQKNPEIEEPELSDLYPMGTLARVIDVIELPNGIKTVIVEGLEKIKILSLSRQKNKNGVMTVSVIPVINDRKIRNKSEFETIIRKIREYASKLTKNAFEQSIEVHLPPIDKISDPDLLLNILSVHVPFDVEEKQRLLDTNNIDKRARMVLGLLAVKDEQAELMKDVMSKTQSRMEEGQRTAFLQQQLDVIRQELDGDDGDDLLELEEKSKTAGFPEAVQDRFNKELRKLKRYNPQSPDYAVQYTYLETLLSLPWQNQSVPADSFATAEKILDKDHYGLKKIKERILEQIALIMNNPEGQSPIICFVGPPGVGKTSLGQSIANALGREFQRVSLGGLHDEAEIRGHRRTYIGAMPGRIIEAMRRSSTVNPVIMLDELDKIGADYKGDPAAALLEVLDPAQNCRFHDNYVDVDYDLSSVTFIATANTLNTISKPLLDRIEVIEITGYTTEEKVEIAWRHILPRLMKKHNVGKDVFSISKEVIKKLIDEYTSESGVRQLEKNLESLMRKRLLGAMRKSKDFSPEVEAGHLVGLLGPAPYMKEKYEGNELPGVVTGLAWTQTGGEILLVEAALAPGKGVPVLTGNLGDVMKESATLALEWVKVNAKETGIDPEVFKNHDVHIHFPEGAIPKDGPSAGITIATAIVSAITGRLVTERTAMTGEITLRGKVLPVGGIKEKLLAAKRAGIKRIVISEENRRNVEDIEKKYLRGLNFFYVKTMKEVLEKALEPDLNR